MMKTCKDCKIEKQETEFYPTQGDCKDCFRERVRENRKNNRKYYEEYDRKRQRLNFQRIFIHRYSGMLARVEGRATRKYEVEGREICTKKEFFEWCNQNIEQFKKIHSAWKRSKWNNKKSPSIDRIDNHKGYTTKNIRWVTKSENSSKYTK